MLISLKQERNLTRPNSTHQRVRKITFFSRSISIRLLLLFVPPLALLDFILNFLFCVSIFPVLFLWCCYPFKPKVLSSRKDGPPFSCCPCHEGCDPWMRVWTSFCLVFSTPFILAGLCLPQLVVSKMVHWADGHTGGYLYLDRKCFCCCCGSHQTQYKCGIFFRNRAVGDVMA